MYTCYWEAELVMTENIAGFTHFIGEAELVVTENIAGFTRIMGG